MTTFFVPRAGMLVLSMALAVAAAFAQNPRRRGDKGIEPKTPVKRVRVDLTGFELGKAPPPKSSTQIGGGTRSTGGETTLLAPVIGRCYSATPSLAWTHTAQVQAFEVRLFNQAGTLVHRMPVSGRQAVLRESSARARQRAAMGRAAAGRDARWTVREIDDQAAERRRVRRGLATTQGGRSRRGQSDGVERTGLHRSSALVRCDFRVVRLNPALPEPRRPARTARGEVSNQLPATQSLADDDFAAAEKLRAGRL